jgi:hypothetical protein
MNVRPCLRAAGIPQTAQPSSLPWCMHRGEVLAIPVTRIRAVNLCRFGARSLVGGTTGVRAREDQGSREQCEVF